jgi:hypothetical protein
MGKALQSRQEILLATYVLNAAIAMKTLKHQELMEKCC